MQNVENVLKLPHLKKKNKNVKIILEFEMDICSHINLIIKSNESINWIQIVRMHADTIDEY